MVKRQKSKIAASSILRAVASSTAIETGESVSSVENRLRSHPKKFSHLKLSK